MGLLDELRHAGQVLDDQFKPASNEIQGILAAVVHYISHGDDFLKAVEGGAQELEQLLAPKPAEPEPAPAPPAAEPTAPVDQPPVDELTADEEALSDAELEARISDLQALQASRQATSQQTTVTHETGVGDAPPAPSSSAS